MEQAAYWRKRFSIIILILAVGLWNSVAWPESTNDLLLKMQQQIEDLQNRLTEQEKRNAELEHRLTAQEQTIAQQAQKVDQVSAVAESAKPAVRSKYPVDFYGYIKLDAAYDTSRTSVGNFARWVESEATNDDDNKFNITARQSRFGLKLSGPEVGRAKTSGRVEVDFYEGGSENKNRLMMRHAYFQMDWPDYDFSLLAGQTSDVISPLVPSTINYPVAWWAGDIGYRRPQVRLTKGFEVGEESRLQFQVAAARTIGDDGPFGSTWDTGEDAGFPTVQGRAAWSFPLLGGRKTTLGVSGHYGQEEYDLDESDDNEDLDTWSANLDLTLPLCDWLTFKGELWTGENLDAYLGGIAQGVNKTTLEEIESTGGWAALSFGPFDQWRFNVGGSIDDPDDNDLNDGDRSQNLSYWGNVLYDLNEAVQLGLELSYWDTEYKNQEDGDSVRIQSSLTYKF